MAASQSPGPPPSAAGAGVRTRSDEKDDPRHSREPVGGSQGGSRGDQAGDSFPSPRSVRQGCRFHRGSPRYGTSPVARMTPFATRPENMGTRRSWPRRSSLRSSIRDAGRGPRRYARRGSAVGRDSIAIVHRSGRNSTGHEEDHSAVRSIDDAGEVRDFPARKYLPADVIMAATTPRIGPGDGS